MNSQLSMQEQLQTYRYDWLKSGLSQSIATVDNELTKLMVGDDLNWEVLIDVINQIDDVVSINAFWKREHLQIKALCLSLSTKPKLSLGEWFLLNDAWIHLKNSLDNSRRIADFDQLEISSSSLIIDEIAVFLNGGDTTSLNIPKDLKIEARFDFVAVLENDSAFMAAWHRFASLVLDSDIANDKPADLAALSPLLADLYISAKSLSGVFIDCQQTSGLINLLSKLNRICKIATAKPLRGQVSLHASLNGLVLGLDTLFRDSNLPNFNGLLDQSQLPKLNESQYFAERCLRWQSHEVACLLVDKELESSLIDKTMISLDSLKQNVHLDSLKASNDKSELLSIFDEVLGALAFLNLESGSLMTLNAELKKSREQFNTLSSNSPTSIEQWAEQVATVVYRLSAHLFEQKIGANQTVAEYILFQQISSRLYEISTFQYLDAAKLEELDTTLEELASIAEFLQLGEFKKSLESLCIRSGETTDETWQQLAKSLAEYTTLLCYTSNHEYLDSRISFAAAADTDVTSSELGREQSNEEATALIQSVSNGSEVKRSESTSSVPQLDEIDPQVLEIFAEEATEIIPLVREMLAGLPSDKSQLLHHQTEVRRYFHTLKGSARMVGLESIAAPAWKIESELNALIETHNVIDEKFVNRASIALLEIEHSLSLCVGDNTSKEIVLPEKSPAGNEKVEDALLRQTQQVILDCAEKEPDSKLPVPEITEAKPDGYTKELVLDAQPDTAFSNSIAQLFIAEAKKHLAIINRYFTAGENICLLLDGLSEVSRAIHTLGGSARIAEFDTVADILAPTESLTAVLAVVDESKLDGSALSKLLHRISTALEESISDYSLGDDCKINTSLLINDIEDWVDLLRNQLAENDFLETFNPSQYLCAVLDCHKSWRCSGISPDELVVIREKVRLIRSEFSSERPVSKLAALIESAYQHFSSAGLHIQAYEILNEAQHSLVDLVVDEKNGALISHSDCIVHLSRLMNDEVTTLENIATIDGVNLYTDNESNDESIDEEIVEIFRVEADELIEALERDIQLWLTEQQNLIYVDRLIRHLHTIKGSSRMAGLKHVATIAHDFESLLEDVRHGRKAISETTFADTARMMMELSSAINSRTLLKESDRETKTPEFSGRSNAGVRSAGTLPKPKDDSPSEDAQIRVSSSLLTNLDALIGEISVSRSMLSERVNSIGRYIDEIDSTLSRLSGQIRDLEISNESRNVRQLGRALSHEEFDPLEMERYNKLQQITRAIDESTSDLKDLKGSLEEERRSAEFLLNQQANIGRETDQLVKQANMASLANLAVPRLRRIAQQIGQELDKPVDIVLKRGEGELDRTVIDKITSSLEHIVRNAIDHGIEDGPSREKQRKPRVAPIEIDISTSSGYVEIIISDDGRGIDIDAVRKKAIEKSLISEKQLMSKQEIHQLLFSAGFSTASKLTEISGRGVGLDVVRSEIRALGGEVELQSDLRVGTKFTIKVPINTASNKSLLVSAAGVTHAVPLDNIQGVVRVEQTYLDHIQKSTKKEIKIDGESYSLYRLTDLYGVDESTHIQLVDHQSNPTTKPILIMSWGDKSYAIQIDSLVGTQHIVERRVSSHLSDICGISSAAIQGDGSIVFVLDIRSLIERYAAEKALSDSTDVVADIPKVSGQKHNKVLVVDDSVTVRKVTSRLLERHSYEVDTAKDGLEAFDYLQARKGAEEYLPSVILIDIEMPRLDGFEVVERLKHDPVLCRIPVVMISSRNSEKHRAKAHKLGVREFLGKPYKHQELIDTISEVTNEEQSERDGAIQQQYFSPHAQPTLDGQLTVNKD